MELHDVMRTAGASRGYAADPVDDATLYRVLDGARFAPSGGNRQPWRIVVVRDAERKRRLREQYVDAYRATAMYAEKGPDPFAKGLDEVPVLLVVCVELASLSITDAGLDRPSIVGGASIYPFVQNVLLALRNEGLAGLLTTMAVPREAALKEIFAIPDGYAVACVLAVGRPDPPLRPLSRRPVEAFAFAESFDGPPLREQAS